MRLKFFLLIFVALGIFLIASFLSFSFFAQKRESPADIGTNLNENQRECEHSTAAVPRPNILSRPGWGASNSIKEMKEHTPHHITIHHTGSPQKDTSIEKKMQNLQNFSQKPGRLASGRHKPAWPDVPYHYFIAIDGRIAEGRDIKYVGDTNTDYDPTGHILVVLEGNFEIDAPSLKQLDSLYELAYWLADYWKIRASEIKGHNDYASTACPGKSLKSLLPAVRQRIEEAMQAIDKRQ